MTISSPPFPLVGAAAPPRPAAAEPTGRPRIQRARRKGADRSGELLDDQWELLALIGSGGMGQVYRALNHVDRRPYAVKVLSSKFSANLSAYERFRHEFMVLRRAAHPHIVAAHAFVERAGESFYSMDLLDGQSLSQATKDGPLPLERVVLLGLQLCEAVGHLHGLGVIHRDIKPNNIIVTQDERGGDHVTILDLGICKLTPRWYANLEVRTDVEMRVHTMTGAPLGTPGYMVDDGDVADEVLKDVFGLGVTLFRIATGHLPYKRSPPKMGDALEWTAADEERIPDALATVLRKAIALDPAVRYQAVVGDSIEITLRSELVQAGMEMGVIPCEEAEGPGGASPPATALPDAWRSVAGPSLAPPRRSAGWIVAAILGLYMVVDLVTAHFDAGTEAPSVDGRPAAEHRGEATPSSAATPTAVPVDPLVATTPAIEVTEIAESSPATPPASSPGTSPPLATEVVEVTEDPPPRPRPRPLSAAGFRKIVTPNQAALDRCARGLRDGPAVDAIVAISADGATLDVQLSPAGISRFAQTCAAEVFAGLHFPRTGATATHTWPLYRPEGREE